MKRLTIDEAEHLHIFPAIISGFSTEKIENNVIL